MKNVIESNITKYMKMYGVSQKELLHRMGDVSRPTWRRWCDEDMFRISDLKMIAKILHTNVSSLVEGVN